MFPFNSFSIIILCYFSLSSSFFKKVISSFSDFFLLKFGLLISALSKMAFLALLANCRVENVSADAEIEGLMQIINLIFPCPIKESLKILVSFEFLKGIWVLDFSIKAEIQCPKQERLPLMFVSS